MEAEKTSAGGLYVPGKDRVVFRAPERKSILGINCINTCSFFEVFTWLLYSWSFALVLILFGDITGLDVLANAKRGESKVDGGFKAPKERVVSVAASMEEEENCGSSIIDETEDNGFTGMRNPARRRYREAAANETPYRGMVFVLFCFI